LSLWCYFVLGKAFVAGFLNSFCRWHTPSRFVGSGGFAVELDIAAVDEAHELVEGVGFFDGVHGAEGSGFVGNVSGIFHGGFRPVLWRTFHENGE